RAARSLHLKKHRAEQRCFLIEGPTAVEAGLGARQLTIERVFVHQGNPRAEAIAPKAASAGLSVIPVDDRTMRSIAQTRSPQGVVAVAKYFHRGVEHLADA